MKKVSLSSPISHGFGGILEGGWWRIAMLEASAYNVEWSCGGSSTLRTKGNSALSVSYHSGKHVILVAWKSNMIWWKKAKRTNNCDNKMKVKISRGYWNQKSFSGASINWLRERDVEVQEIRVSWKGLVYQDIDASGCLYLHIASVLVVDRLSHLPLYHMLAPPLRTRSRE